ncbi:conserved hypothetical protein [Shewanella sediminis HAW-EB3]|uniref:Uncharacterized protein n=1 Tax=Shewanella sediminis (strain HAW-EB3) TaxID=425104 RepID=A8FS28_SHESH|nr:hypothetical protein [Shewanella sediminis]ABV35651.1 conserved hypothetical protein [Shewanella sediminis HAW-EB3]
MHLSNAEQWAQLCHRQAELVESLSKTFPERRENHTDLGLCWRRLEQQVRRGETPRVDDIK